MTTAARPPQPDPAPADRSPLCAAFDEVLDTAQTHLWLAVPWVYTRRNDAWLLAFIARVAAARGQSLDVRAYLRPDPANAYAVAIWRDAGVQVVQDTPRTRFLHSKLLVTESAARLSTANLTDTDLFRNVNHVSLERDPAQVAAYAASLLELEDCDPRRARRQRARVGRPSAALPAGAHAQPDAGRRRPPRTAGPPPPGHRRPDRVG
jgi:hypothetical protein